MANLQLLSYAKARTEIKKVWESDAQIIRYWALNVCSSFGKEAEEFVPMIREIANSDDEAINRVRAAEYLALYGFDEPQQVMVEALYSVKDPVEATLILNSMTLLAEGEQKVEFTIEKSRLAEGFEEHALVKSALEKHKTK